MDLAKITPSRAGGNQGSKRSYRGSREINAQRDPVVGQNLRLIRWVDPAEILPPMVGRKGKKAGRDSMGEEGIQDKTKGADHRLNSWVDPSWSTENPPRGRNPQWQERGRSGVGMESKAK